MGKLVLMQLTPYQRQMRERNRKIVEEYNKLTSVEGQSKMMVVNHLKDKYGMQTSAAIYKILKKEGGRK